MKDRLPKLALAAVVLGVAWLVFWLLRQNPIDVKMDGMLEDIGRKTSEDFSFIRNAGTNCIPHLLEVVREDTGRLSWRLYIPGERDRAQTRYHRALGAVQALIVLGHDNVAPVVPELQKIAAGPEPAASYAQHVLIRLGYPVKKAS